MFYLKYRPKQIKDIDNPKIQDQINNILNAETLPHALLFIGQKGTGKTSAARIFSKAINCKKNKFSLKSKIVEPCNNCHNCLSIDKNISPDIIEMDAASHRGIEEIKNLIKDSAFAPMSANYRVFIIDEAHMITPDGFNALLKTIEEPPKSVFFILATTNIEKIPITIKSRCLTMNFGKASIDNIINMLKRINKAENIKIDNNLLTLIAKSSDNSFRDAAKTLQELIIQKKLNFEEAQTYLGIRGKDNFLSILQNKDVNQALVWIEEFYQTGNDIKGLIIQVMEDLRLLILEKNKIKENNNHQVNLSLKQISLLMKLLNEAYSNLRNSPLEIIPLEVAIIEFYNKQN